ncbi:MAG: type II toxin-antitoxin system mRNA interferase toxin, RelE/StbE family, partial [bacterium]|nr:type II toxin-antitoxin system mRNA interferase toxin, RelE/StbE family [bacterium]
VKEIRKVSTPTQARIWRAIDRLSSHWHEGKKLCGEYSGCRVIRVWPYRIIYEVHKRKLLIVILRVADRKDAYR